MNFVFICLSFTNLSNQFFYFILILLTSITSSKWLKEWDKDGMRGDVVWDKR